MTLPPVSAARARALITTFPGQRILVVGDVMLDRFLVGHVTRISPEAPVPVVRVDREYLRLGGAANVAHNLRALGADVSLIGVVGQDQAAERLTTALVQSGIAAEDLVEDRRRPTIEKVRIVTNRNQQVARLDYEDDTDIPAEVEADVIERIERAGAAAAVLVVSDYLKGTVTAAVMQALVRRKGKGPPLLVDPKIPHLACYAGATLVTPNHDEAETATHLRIRTVEDRRVAAAEFRRRARCDAALVTLGEHGMWLSSAEAEGAIPAAAREVADVTGAGDTVVATLGLAIAAGATLAEAALLANRAAGIVVGKFGPSTLDRDELLAQFA